MDNNSNGPSGYPSKCSTCGNRVGWDHIRVTGSNQTHVFCNNGQCEPSQVKPKQGGIQKIKDPNQGRVPGLPDRGEYGPDSKGFPHNPGNIGPKPKPKDLPNNFPKPDPEPKGKEDHYSGPNSISPRPPKDPNKLPKPKPKPNEDHYEGPNSISPKDQKKYYESPKPKPPTDPKKGYEKPKPKKPLDPNGDYPNNFGPKEDKYKNPPKGDGDGKNPPAGGVQPLKPKPKKPSGSGAQSLKPKPMGPAKARPGYR
jgi:hypothetical protein